MKKYIFALLLVFISFAASTRAQIPVQTLVRIVKAEDELRYDETLENLIKNKNAKIRERAALAAGRIGDERAIPALAARLETDESIEVRVMIAFALGEIESAKGADSILSSMRDEKNYRIFARTIEAAGKIAAANPKDEKLNELRAEILQALEDESFPANPDRTLTLLALTAVLRAKPDGEEAVVAKFLSSSDARIRADALNTLARLRSKNVNAPSREMLAGDSDPLVRANAARMLGVGADQSAFDLLLNAALKDADSRVRVSAIRSLGNLKDKQAAPKLMERGAKLLADFKKSKLANPPEKNELLEIAAAVGSILPNTNDKNAVEFLDELHRADKFTSPETEIALARIAPKIYVDSIVRETNQLFKGDWRASSAAFQGLGEIANLESNAENNLIKSRTRLLLIQLIAQWINANSRLEAAGNESFAVPDLLRAFAAFKSENTTGIFTPMLEIERDVFIRAALAEILGDQPPTKELAAVLNKSFATTYPADAKYNDARLAILDALFKLDKQQAVPTLLTALDAPDYLVRHKAFELLKDNDLQSLTAVKTALENFKARHKNQVAPYNPKTETKLGQVLNYNADYLRAVSRKSASAVITTEKGSFTIEFFPEAAPLTVDNFIKLARANYFNNLTIHRVVPNFVVQDGDPRGDSNGGPGWEIRDEINEIPYERGTVGMALSGKNTGGSQWFITHSPQPHLDGGYTVFGKVNETGMKIVDNLARGDKITSVKIIEEKTSKE